MSKENQRHAIHWQTAKTTSGIEFQQMVGAGWTMPPKDFMTLLESIPDESYRQKTLEVIATGWKQMATVVHGGGIVRHVGVIHTPEQIPFHYPPELKERIADEGLYSNRVLHFIEQYDLELERLAIATGELVSFVAPEFHTRMFMHPEYGPMYHMNNTGRSIEHMSNAFGNMFKRLYEEAGIPPIAASPSAVNVLLGSMARHEKLDVLTGIKPDR